MAAVLALDFVTRSKPACGSALLNQPDFRIVWVGGKVLSAGECNTGFGGRSKCTVSSGSDARANFTLSSPMRKIHQAPFTCLEPDRELFNPSWMLDLVMSKKNAADIQIDHIHSRAICDEIGERLRQALKREPVGLPPQLQLLVNRLAELDGAAAPSIVPSFEEMLPQRELHSSSV